MRGEGHFEVCDGLHIDSCGARLAAEVPRSLIMKPENQWTVAVDLRLNLHGGSKYKYLGADQKFEKLKELAAATESKPVTFAVQVSMIDSEQKHTFHAERYLIRDGALTKISSPENAGSADHVGDILEFAAREFPSAKLGFIVFSHGFGQRGIAGDAGTTDLNQLSDSIQSSLKAVDLSTVDAMFFDSCSMGEADVLAKVPFAKNVVASAELVPCAKDESCGLDLNGILTTLIQNPGMSGSQFAHQAISVTEENAKTFQAGAGPDTLAHFRSEGSTDSPSDGSFKSLGDAVNKFGTDLADAMEVPSNRRTIADILDNTQSYRRFEFVDMPGVAQRDLTDFAHRIEEALDEHRIDDRTGRLKEDVTSVLSEYHKITPQYFGTQQNDLLDPPMTASHLANQSPDRRVPYDNLGGLSIFLPDPDHTHLGNTPFGKLMALTDSGHERAQQIKSAATFLSELPALKTELGKDRTRSHAMAAFERNATKLSGMSKAFVAHPKTFNQADFDRTLNEIRSNLREIGKNHNIQSTNRLAVDQQTIFPGWRQFVYEVDKNW